MYGLMILDPNGWPLYSISFIITLWPSIHLDQESNFPFIHFHLHGPYKYKDKENWKMGHEHEMNNKGKLMSPYVQFL